MPLFPASHTIQWLAQNVLPTIVVCGWRGFSMEELLPNIKSTIVSLEHHLRFPQTIFDKCLKAWPCSPSVTQHNSWPKCATYPYSLSRNASLSVFGRVRPWGIRVPLFGQPFRFSLMGTVPNIEVNHRVVLFFRPFFRDWCFVAHLGVKCWVCIFFALEKSDFGWSSLPWHVRARFFSMVKVYRGIMRRWFGVRLFCRTTLIPRGCGSRPGVLTSAWILWGSDRTWGTGLQYLYILSYDASSQIIEQIIDPRLTWCRYFDMM